MNKLPLETELEAYDIRNNKIKSYALSKPINYFGSGPNINRHDCNFYSINKKFNLSKYHFVVKIKKTGIYIKDLESNDGVEFANRKIRCESLREYEVLPDDEVIAGMLKFKLKGNRSQKCRFCNNYITSNKQNKMERGYYSYICPKCVSKQTSLFINGKYKTYEKIKSDDRNGVYKAVEIESGKLVVIKTFRDVDRSEFSELKNELFINNDLQHKNILNYEDVVTFNNNAEYGIVYNFVKWGDLHSHIEKEGLVTLELGCHIVLQLLEALIYAHDHDRGIIHHDVKPSNILLVEDISNPRTLDMNPTIKLSDFGISEISNKQSAFIENNVFKGTPQFAAPEQFTTQPKTFSIDLYAVGVTFYYIISKKLPYNIVDDDDYLQLRSKIESNERVSIESVLNGVPKQLATIINKSVKRNAQERYRGAEEFREDLRNFYMSYYRSAQTSS